MPIKLASISVDDQERALRFSTDVLGFVKHAAVRQGPCRVAFTRPPTPVTGSTIALLDDTRGNLIQFAQLTWGG